MRKVKLGIIGMGNMGFGHMKGIIAQADCEIEITAIADRVESKLEATKKHIAEYNEKNPDNASPIPATFSEGSDLIKSGLCEAVLIAVPHYDHPVLGQSLPVARV